MRTLGAKETVVAQGLGHVLAHAVPDVGFALRRIPDVMGDKLEEQAFGRRPGKGASRRSQRQGFEISHVRRQGPQGVFAHSLAGKVFQRLDVAVSQDLRQAIAPVDRQDGRERIELLGAPLLRIGPEPGLLVDVISRA